MASPPKDDIFRDSQRWQPFLDHCGGEHSTNVVPNSQGRNHNQRSGHSEMKETEDFLASEMNKLSVQERSRALEDVHCVGEELKETPAMIEQALIQFDSLVQTTSDWIYTVAVNQNRSYVEDRSFRLKFLRANLFNVRKSVHQMMTFLKQKALYFGESKVAHDIGRADMNLAEIALLQTGFLQVLKDRDRSGRVIVYDASASRLPVECDTETYIHVLYHIIFNVVLSLSSVQAKGVVVIYYDESKGEANQTFRGFSFLAKTCSFLNALPFRTASLHLSFHSSPGSLVLHNQTIQFILRAMPNSILPRTRLHHGSDLERQYHLRTFGIPLENFPVDTDGNLRNGFHACWCDEYLRNSSNESVSIEPQAKNNTGALQMETIRDTDVLFGRGRFMQNHAGNIRFREFLDRHAEVYEHLSRAERIRACDGYTRELFSSGTRFLRQNENHQWVVCDFDQVLEKVKQFFRTSRNKRRKQGELGSEP